MKKNNKYEDSPLDEKRDRAEARKRKMSMKEWEGSKEDRRQDAMYRKAKRK